MECSWVKFSPSQTQKLSSKRSERFMTLNLGAGRMAMSVRNIVFLICTSQCRSGACCQVHDQLTHLLSGFFSMLAYTFVWLKLSLCHGWLESYSCKRLCKFCGSIQSSRCLYGYWLKKQAAGSTCFLQKQMYCTSVLSDQVGVEQSASSA